MRALERSAHVVRHYPCAQNAEGDLHHSDTRDGVTDQLQLANLGTRHVTKTAFSGFRIF